MAPQMGPMSWIPLIILSLSLFLLYSVKCAPPLSRTPPTPPRALPLFWVW